MNLKFRASHCALCVQIRKYLALFRCTRCHGNWVYCLEMVSGTNQCPVLDTTNGYACAVSPPGDYIQMSKIDITDFLKMCEKDVFLAALKLLFGQKIPPTL